MRKRANLDQVTCTVNACGEGLVNETRMKPGNEKIPQVVIPREMRLILVLRICPFLFLG